MPKNQINTANNKTKYCTICNVQLEKGINILSCAYATSNFKCKSCLKNYKNKQYRNSEKQKECNKRYYYKNKDKCNNSSKKYYYKNIEKMRSYHKKYSKNQNKLFKEDVTKEVRKELKQSIDTEELFNKVYNKIKK